MLGGLFISRKHDTQLLFRTNASFELVLPTTL